MRSQAMKVGIFVLWAVAALAAGGVAYADTSAGTAVGVNPSADNVLDNVSRTIVVGDGVQMGDTIKTGDVGQVQLIFQDQTHLVVGPNSSLLLQSYLLQGPGTASKFAIDALSGSFRFITGKSNHAAYSISTPSGTIGIRGTAFDFVVNPTSQFVGGRPPGTTVTLFRGALSMCSLSGSCVTLSHSCQVGTITPTNSNLVPNKNQKGLKSGFDYVQSQTPLLADFQVSGSEGCLKGEKLTLAEILELCKKVSGEESHGDLRHKDNCVDEVRDWAGDDQSADDVAQLVIDLAGLVNDKSCTGANTEIGQAIAEAAHATDDQTQQARIDQVSFTITHCQPQIQTASIPPVSISGP